MTNHDVYTITGDEEFVDGDQNLGFNMIDFWRFQFPNIYDYHGELAEFIVAKALGKDKADNKDYWTRYDIEYLDKKDRALKIEVKASAYYYSWQSEKSKINKKRFFGIRQTHRRFDENAARLSGREVKQSVDVLERPSDLYVFCLNTGENREAAYTLNVEHWEFYVVPTYVIDRECGNGKTISLKKIQKLGFEGIKYRDLRKKIDEISNEVHSIGNRPRA